MEVGEAEPLAKGRYAGRGFMIAGQHICPGGAAFENLAYFVEAVRPAHQIAGGKVVVGLHIDEPFQSLEIAMNVGEEKEPHRAMD